jgi:hypothetical protein
MVSPSQIRAYVAMLIDREIGLNAFEDWFVSNTWNIHRWGSKAAEVLTFAIEESLSEYSSGHISEQQLCRELSDIIYADTKTVSYVEAVPRRVSTGIRFEAVAA